MGVSINIGVHHYYSHEFEEDDKERIDPCTLVRPSAPAFGRHDEGGDAFEDMSLDSYEFDVAPDRNKATEDDIWLKEIEKEEDLQNLFSFHVYCAPKSIEGISNPFPILEGSFRGAEVHQDEESSSEDGEGDTLYETVYFGRNRVKMSFVAYKAEENETYNYVMKGISGLLYCPYSLFQPQGQWKPTAEANRRSSRMHDSVQELNEMIMHSPSQFDECLPPARRTTKLAPLRVRLLSASLQNRAMAARKTLCRHGSSHKYSLPSKHLSETREGGELSEPLHGWELRVIESLYELERL